MQETRKFTPRGWEDGSAVRVLAELLQEPEAGSLHPHGSLIPVLEESGLLLTTKAARHALGA